MKAEEKPPAVQDEDDDEADAAEHDDSLHEVVERGGHIAADHDVDAGEQGDAEHAPGEVDAERHREKAGQALVDRGGVGHEEDEDDDRRDGAQSGAAVPLGEEIGHGGRLEVLGHDAGAPPEHHPGEQAADEALPMPIQVEATPKFQPNCPA